jgi:hypothetical protein
MGTSPIPTPPQAWKVNELTPTQKAFVQKWLDINNGADIRPTVKTGIDHVIDKEILSQNKSYLIKPDATIESGNTLTDGTNTYPILFQGVSSIDSGDVATVEIIAGNAYVGKYIIDVLEASQIPDLDASKIKTGVFATARIPNLDAAKIDSGTFNPARIPNLDAAKIDSGTFDPARIPNLDASKTTTGVFDAARIPNLDAAKIDSGVFDDARIPNLDAAKITTGVFAAARIPAATETAIGGVEEATETEMNGGAPGKFPDAFTIKKFTGGLQTIVLEIGDWDMDTDSSKTLLHGLTRTLIRRVTAFVRNDGNSVGLPLNSFSQANGVNGGVNSTDNSLITLSRLTGGVFDNVSYSTTSYNRGWVIVEYASL